MSITRDITLYLNAGITTPEVVHVNQYDQGEVWRFTLLESDGSKYTPSSGALIGVKADGHAIAGVTGTVLGDGRVQITETQQMTAAAGDAIFELTIDGLTHGTANFTVRVEKKPTDGAILSDSDLSIIQEGLNSVTPAAINESVSDYLEENMTNPPIDPTLSISNAAADAKVTGDKITELKTAFNALNGRDLPLVFEHGFIVNGEDSVYWKESRVRMPFPVKLENDMSITALSADTHCTFVIAYYNDDLTYNRTVTWSRTATIPKNTYFRLVLSLDYSTNTAESVENIVKAFSWSLDRTSTIEAEITALTGRVDDLETDVNGQIESIESDIADLSTFVSYEDESISDIVLTSSSIDTRDGTAYPGSSYWMRMKYAEQVSEGDIITYTGHAYNNSGGVCFYDNNGVFVDAPVKNTGSTEQFYDGVEIVVPSGVSFVLCADTNQSSTNQFSVKIRRKTKTESTGYKMRILYVGSNNQPNYATGLKGNPFASILTANNYISENSESNRFTIILLNGTYTDMQTFYSGKDGTYQSGAYQGVVCKDYVYYESQDINNPQNCIIQWDGLTGFTSPQSYDDVFVYKCPFHICSVHTHVKGFKFICKNLRYCMHIESSGYGRNAQWEVANCIFDWGNCPDQIGNPDTPTIGMGTSHFENGYIHDCVLLNSTPNYAGSGIMTHDNRWASSNTPFMYKGARLKLENIDFGNNSIRVRTMIAPQYYNTKNIIEINGCDNIDMFSHAFLSGMTVKEWDDIVLGSTIADNQFDN